MRQSGVVACWQAPRLGLTANEVRERLRYGDWQRLHHGVYATFTGRPDREAQLWGALLRAGPVAVLSHHTAAERHGLLPRPSAAIHVTVGSRNNPARNRKIPGVVVHRSAVILSRCHPAMTPPCTRVEETVLDLIKVARTPDEAYDWICRALGQRRTTAERIRAALQARERVPLGSYNLVMADDASAQAREDQRATHEDRDRVVEVLRLAAGDGRLTVEELDERVGAALTARTYGELTALVSDLPAARDTPAGPPGAPGPKDLVRIECHHSGARRDGQWLVPRRMQIQVTIGNVLLDFTQAILSWPALQIDVQIHSGTLTLVTRPGIMVDTDDLEILQASTVKVLAPWDPDVLVRFRIDVAGTLDVSSITARPPRRTLSQQQALPPPRP